MYCEELFACLNSLRGRNYFPVYCQYNNFAVSKVFRFLMLCPIILACWSSFKLRKVLWDSSQSRWFVTWWIMHVILRYLRIAEQKKWAISEFWHVIDFSSWKKRQTEWCEFWAISKSHAYSITWQISFYDFLSYLIEPPVVHAQSCCSR